MPKSELEAIADDEWLFRRIRLERIQWEETPPISPNAFAPRVSGREPDFDGISLFRADCLDDASSVVPANRRAFEVVARIPVAAVRAMGLTVDSKPVEAAAGHVVLRELNAEAVKSNRDAVARWTTALAKIASEPGNIVLRPEGV